MVDVGLTVLAPQSKLVIHCNTGRTHTHTQSQVLFCCSVQLLFIRLYFQDLGSLKSNSAMSALSHASVAHTDEPHPDACDRS